MKHSVSVVFEFEVEDQADKDYLDGVGFLADLGDLLLDTNYEPLSLNGKSKEEIQKLLQAAVPE